MLLPRYVQSYIGQTYIDFGVLFYVYIVMLVIFCTNAINIIAGINGVECGQSIVIAISVAIFNLVQIVRLNDELVWCHCLSFCILGPFIASSIGLYLHNKYPARAFVGDTYCYFAGMTLAVVAVIGHFSKTLLLFLIPQVMYLQYTNTSSIVFCYDFILLDLQLPLLLPSIIQIHSLPPPSSAQIGQGNGSSEHEQSRVQAKWHQPHWKNHHSSDQITWTSGLQRDW